MRWRELMTSAIGWWWRTAGAGCVLAIAANSLPPALAADTPEADPASLLAIGQRIYRDGVLPDGSALQGAVGGAVLSGTLAACETCHRRSGMGSREGQLIVAPITGPSLRSKTEFHWPTRPGRPAPAVEPMRLDSRAAYDDASLARAIRFGVDSRDRPLAEPMPRYAIADDAMRALSAYLWQLSARTDPGLGVNGGMALATIVTDDADPARRDTVVQTLKAWADDRRADSLSPKLQIWQLTRDASTWRAQLEALYRAEPVFAVLSGAGGGNWAPVHDFCEAQALPCLFPVVDAAPSRPGDGYTLYFDTGVAIEAALLAQHVASLDPPPQRVVQLVGGGWQSAAAQTGAAELASRLADAGNMREVKFEMPAIGLIGLTDTGADPAALASAIKAAAGEIDQRDLLVAWLSPADLKRLALAWPALAKDADAPQLIASARLAAPEAVLSPALAIPAAFRQHLNWVSTRSDPARRHGNAVIGLLPWLKRLGLEVVDEALQAEVYAATYFFSDALARMRAPRSREYLIEMLESTFYSRPAGAAFYTLSLGPRQRVAVKGGHLLGLAAPDFLRVVPLGARIVPGSE